MVVPVTLVFVSGATLGTISCPLLLAFIFFFVFTKGVTQVRTIHRFFSFLLAGDALVFSILSYRVVDGIPSTILLSRFARGCTSLLVNMGVNKTNALVTSLTDLVAFERCTARGPGGFGRCVVAFSTFGFKFLTILATFTVI